MDVERVFAYISIAILCVFVCEHVLLVVALGREYFKSVMRVVDLCVIIVSLVLEILFRGE